MAAALPEDLAAESAAAGGALIGYARVSTAGQLLDRQVRALEAAGCTRIFADKLSGKTADRPELAACLDYLRPGDTLVVPSLDRLSRSLQDLITTVPELRRLGVGFRSLHEGLDTTTAGGRLVFHVFAALAEFIRELIVEGTHEGLDAARARGVRLGRPPAMTAEQVRHARDLLARPENTVSSIARLLSVSRSTIYKYLPELAGPRALKGGGRGELPAARQESRPGRAVVVAASLAELCGPAAGPVELPLRLFWSSPDRVFDLGEPSELQSLYETVLREASRPDDLARYLHAGTLVRVWPELYLPKGVRQAWEDRYPELRHGTQAVA
jgi:DNA invertase Pin-like site-specific DNA recombinase